MTYLHLPCSSSSPTLRGTLHPSLTQPLTTSFHLCPPQRKPTSSNSIFTDFKSKSLRWALSGALTLGFSLAVAGTYLLYYFRYQCLSKLNFKCFVVLLNVVVVFGVGGVEAKVGVNKPELLPKEFSTVIDVAGFLSDGQEKRLAQEISDIEKDTGFKLRVLAQNYPDTPGLAIRDFWQVDDSTIVFVADPTFGNILNFNVGASVDLDIPRSFWSRLAGKYGNIFYWKEKVESPFVGEDASIEAAVMAISSCLREPVGPNNCSDVK
ncbi:Thylakoid lumenal 15.0 kDa protein [Parasponia andersonii]|uniref:Thylakoid lumenal 15.0 kDa protein n=1 Tax=Parasponia andersonii TaxID=3476 RepID=A0A2P5CH04_PARAD|nr:Thylakoid lumenal 15.0 kDa protein [Parasponia andersonii]